MVAREHPEKLRVLGSEEKNSLRVDPAQSSQISVTFASAYGILTLGKGGVQSKPGGLQRRTKPAKKRTPPQTRIVSSLILGFRTDTSPACSVNSSL